MTERNGDVIWYSDNVFERVVCVLLILAHIAGLTGSIRWVVKSLVVTSTRCETLPEPKTCVVLKKKENQWHDAPRHEGFLNRYGAFFALFQPHIVWYAAVDPLIALLMSVMVSFKAQSDVHCLINGICYSLLLLSINVVTILKLHPYRAPRNTYLCARSDGNGGESAAVSAPTST